MGFFRTQEENIAMRLLARQYQKAEKLPPAEEELRRQAAYVVDEAHRIARQRGRNVVGIIKELIREWRK